MSKTAVVIFNLGGPDSAESIKPFLFNFFIDPNIIRLPYPLRWCVAKLISVRRSKGEAAVSYGFLGGKSPLLENTKLQADALQKELGDDFRTFVCMRYWHPMAPEIVQQVKDYAPDRIVILPLYPQFSTTTTGSSMRVWNIETAKAGLDAPTSVICCYPRDPGFIKASAQNVVSVYEKALQDLTGKNLPPPRVLFSAHGLPESIVKAGDPYQWQCEKSAAAIAEATGIADLDWQICYQSRVGPMKWIGPSTDEALEKAAADGVPVIVYPHAFTQEHVETLVEIEMEYREAAEELGIPYFARVPTVDDDKNFIAGLAAIVRERAERDDTPVAPAGGEKTCPEAFINGCLSYNCRRQTKKGRRTAREKTRKAA